MTRQPTGYLADFLILLGLLTTSHSWGSLGFQTPLLNHGHLQTSNSIRPFCSNTRIFRQGTKWDNLLDKDDDNDGLLPATPDMKYVERNVFRQHQNFVAIREAGGKEMTNDVYVPERDSEIFWFVGKVARTSDVSVEQAIARQWPLIEQHAANLRPIELFPSRGSLEIWIAPGDSEIEVSYNQPDVIFQKMEKQVEGASSIKSNMIGFQGEIYEKGQGMGFRTWRKADGSPAKAEIQTPEAPSAVSEVDDTEYSEEKFRAPTEEELKRLQEALKEKNMDVSDLYEQQQGDEQGKSD